MCKWDVATQLYYAWASADFFPGRAKFSKWGKKILFAQKHQKDTIFVLKSQKTYYFGQPGGVKGPLLPSPSDAHENIAFNYLLINYFSLDHQVSPLKPLLD